MSISGLTNIFSNPNPKLLNSLSISNTNTTKLNGNCRIKLRVCAKTKDCEVNFAPNARVYGQFSAPVKPSSSTTSSSSSPYASSKQRKEEEDKQDYYVNMGYAIRCLREEFPELFYREPSFDIYRWICICYHNLHSPQEDYTSKTRHGFVRRKALKSSSITIISLIMASGLLMIMPPSPLLENYRTFIQGTDSL